MRHSTAIVAGLITGAAVAGGVWWYRRRQRLARWRAAMARNKTRTAYSAAREAAAVESESVDRALNRAATGGALPGAPRLEIIR